MNAAITKDIETLRQEKFLEFTKKKAALRYRIQGMAKYDKRWFNALRALNFAEEHHTGYRKDGISPEFLHQVDVVSYVLTLPDLIDPVGTVVAAILHDTPEDSNVSHEEIRDLFGKKAQGDVELLTKEYRGKKKNLEEYFQAITNPRVTICKGVDRVINQNTMARVFKLEKQIEYCSETKKHFFKFLKQARRQHPEQEAAYENIKFVLKSQIYIFDSIHAQGLAA